MPTLTVIIPTFNEESFVKGALHSVLFADEIIVIDSFSTDKTSEIAKKYATKFRQRKFDNFSNQKNFALKEATGDWVLFLDADERVTHSLKVEIKETIANTAHSGFKINFPHFFMNRFLYHESDKVVRLVKREVYAWFQAGQLLKKDKKPSLFVMIYRPAFRFFKSYIIKGGFKDGIPGLAIAAITAYGVFQRYVKLRLLQKGMR